jgi:hypothetical protein
MLLNPHKDTHIKEFVEKKLLMRLRIFFFIIFILFDCIILEISLNNINPLLSLAAVCGGMICGLFFVRRKRIFWHEETNSVIARMDKIGIIILIVYIVFVVVRHWLLEHWLHGHQLTAFSLSFATGSMIGRVWSIRRLIRRHLKQQKII